MGNEIGNIGPKVIPYINVSSHLLSYLITSVIFIELISKYS